MSKNLLCLSALGIGVTVFPLLGVLRKELHLEFRNLSGVQLSYVTSEVSTVHKTPRWP